MDCSPASQLWWHQDRSASAVMLAVSFRIVKQREKHAINASLQMIVAAI
jgi:hypothetical protein